MPERATVDDCRRLLSHSRESEERLIGIFGQDWEIADWADENDFEIVGRVRDNAVSGFTPFVFRFDAVFALWAGMAGQHRGFVYSSQTRLARDPLEKQMWVNACTWARLSLWSIELGRDVTKDQTVTEYRQRMEADLRGLIEVTARLEEMAAGRKRKRDRGGKSGGRPLQRKYGTRTVLIGGRPEYVPVPAEQAVIRRVQEACVDGKGYAAMARQLNAEGVPTVTGAPWSRKTVGDLLKPGRLSRLEAVPVTDVRGSVTDDGQADVTTGAQLA